MHVSQFTRWTATFRLMRRLQFTRVGQQAFISRMEEAWWAHCGLRMEDLRRSVFEMVAAHMLLIEGYDDGAVLELTDRGALSLSGAYKPQTLRLAGPVTSLRTRLQTEWVLHKARQRCSSSTKGTLGHFDLDRRRTSESISVTGDENSESAH